MAALRRTVRVSRWRSGLLALSVMVGLVGCTGTSNSPRSGTSDAETTQKPKVVATNTVLCDLTKQIAQTTIQLTCLMSPGTDPHVYQPTPTDRSAIEDANLILYGGYGLEPSLTRLVKATSNSAPKVAVFEQAVKTPLHGAHEHTGATDTQDLDPHVWHDAKNGIQIVQVIEQQLETLSRQNATRYQKNAQTIIAQLTQIDRWIRSQIATIPPNARKLVTTHDALNYYAAAYGIPIEGALQGLSTEEQATPTQMKQLVDEVKSSKVPTIFVEKTSNPKLIEAVAQEAGVKISDQSLFADGLGAAGSGAETYEAMLLKNTAAIVTGLGGKLTPFQAKFTQP